MKKYIIIFFVLVVVVIAGYLTYNNYQNSSKYTLNLQSQLNPSDYHTPGTQIKETAETYTSNSVYYRVQVMEFSDVNIATQGLSKLKEVYNPGMIGLNGKYVNYLELAPSSNFYFYQSGKFILVIEMTGDKNLSDTFVIWYYSKYPNK